MSEISIKAEADFIKTSTGKVPVNTTPESARIKLFGANWADARHYRFGASSLLASLLNALVHDDGKSTSDYMMLA